MSSLSRIAERLVRANGEAAVWQGLHLRTHFQPLVSIRREACVGYEALVRASDASGMPVRPDALFARAYGEGSGIELDWICRALHLRSYALVDPGDRKLFVNVHPEAAASDANRARELADLAGYYGLSTRRVCVEILEAPCVDEGLLREAVAAYRALGATIAMDDFGLARSNFDRIVRLRPDVVKIDRSILVDAVGDEKARRLLPAVVELLHEAGAEVAVEGVESANEALIAIDAGADHLQGHYLGAPAAALADEPLAARLVRKLRHVSAPRAAVGGR